MDYTGDKRPPRSARPTSQIPQSHSPSPDPQFQQQQQQQQQRRYPGSPPPEHRSNVQFQTVERGDRQGPLDPQRQRGFQSAYQPQIAPGVDPETADFDTGRVGRKKSLVRPDREKIEPGHRQWHYRSHVAQLSEERPGRVGVMPSSTCNSNFFMYDVV